MESAKTMTYSCSGPRGSVLVMTNNWIIVLGFLVSFVRRDVRSTAVHKASLLSTASCFPIVMTLNNK